MTVGTVRDLADGKSKGGYLPTSWGAAWVNSVDTEWRVHAPKENAGFGMSYYVTPDTVLYATPAEANRAHEEHKRRIAEVCSRLGHSTLPA
ncbi:MAG: hypothetical protein K6T35_13945 [Meiothermus silvanus]|nr:hypothetical protein [Allomeiothermus silvanus]